MGTSDFTLLLRSPGHSAEMAEQLGSRLGTGDVILLDGPVGAGKTHFARHVIQSLLTEPEDIPSPTFTLVQTYDTPAGDIWHSDLYRLGSTLEIEELGLIDAFDTAICLVEWPDRLGDLVPEDALTLHFGHCQSDEDARTLRAEWTGQKWHDKLAGWNNA